MANGAVAAVTKAHLSEFDVAGARDHAGKLSGNHVGLKAFLDRHPTNENELVPIMLIHAPSIGRHAGNTPSGPLTIVNGSA
jgi:hypothetical protein